MRNTQQDLCGPEEPGRAGKLTKSSHSSGYGGLGFFPLHFLTHEVCAAGTFPTSSYISPCQSCLKACLFCIPKTKRSESEPANRGATGLCLASVRTDTSPPAPVNNQTLLLARRREHPPPNTCNKALAITALSPGN